MKFIMWMGSQSKLLNGAVVGWFMMSGLIGTIVGIIIGISISGQ